MIDNDKVIQVTFGPNNLQDFGFSGSLFIMADSSYQVRKVELHIPSHSEVNFVEDMIITQDFAELPTGERVVVNNDMLVELKLASFLNELQVQRVIRHTNFSFDEIADIVFCISRRHLVRALNEGRHPVIALQQVIDGGDTVFGLRVDLLTVQTG